MSNVDQAATSALLVCGASKLYHDEAANLELQPPHTQPQTTKHTSKPENSQPRIRPTKAG